MPKNKRVMDLSAHSPRTRSRGPLVGSAADDRGFMIIEVVVSAILVLIVGMGTLAVIDSAGEASAMNRARSVTSALAQREQDQYRQMPWSVMEAKFASLTDGFSVNENGSRSVNGRTYDITNKLTIVENPLDEQTGCLAGWVKKRVRVDTTAVPTSGLPKKPIAMTSYRAPSLLDSAGKGSVMVRLAKADGTNANGVSVKVTAQAPASYATLTTTTDTKGCAIFRDVLPGPAIVSWGDAAGGMVDENGGSPVERYVTVAKGRTEQLAGRFDTAKSLTVSLIDDDSPAKPATWNNVSVGNGGITSVYNGVRTWPRTPSARVPATSFTADRLFPFVAPYAVYAGSCTGNNPAAWATSVDGSNIFKVTDASGAKNVVMPRVTVKTVKADGTPSAPASGGGWEVFVKPDDTVSQMGVTQGCGGEGFFPSDDEYRATEAQWWKPTAWFAGFPPWPYNPGFTDTGFQASERKAWGGGSGAGVAANVPKTDPTTGIVTFPLPYGVWRVCIQEKNATKGMWRNFSVWADKTGGRLFNTPSSTTGTYAKNTTLVATMEAPATGTPATRFDPDYKEVPDWKHNYGGWWPANAQNTTCANGW